MLNVTIEVPFPPISGSWWNFPNSALPLIQICAIFGASFPLGQEGGANWGGILERVPVEDEFEEADQYIYAPSDDDI